MTTAAWIIAYLAASCIAALVLGRVIRAADDTDTRDVMLTGNACDHDDHPKVPPSSGARR